MNIHEYQAKELLKNNNLSIPNGFLIQQKKEIPNAIKKLKNKAVIKAQIHAGGRGKVGGVKIINSLQEANEIAENMLGKNLSTNQTSEKSVPVNSLLIEELINIKREIYFSIIMDPSNKTPTIITSPEGGMEIEELAQKAPEKLFFEPVDPLLGLQSFQIRQLGIKLKLSKNEFANFSRALKNLFNVFVKYDCSLLEINPLVITDNDDFVCLDAKIILEDDALFRHAELTSLNDPSQTEPLENSASKYGIAYVKLSGTVGCLVNGAGLAMATMDIIQSSGAKPANFLDVGGGASEEKVKEAFKIILTDKSVKIIFVNIFGGILRCDIVARGIIMATKNHSDTSAIVVRMQGTNFEEGRKILQNSKLKVNFVETLDEATTVIKHLSQEEA